MVRQEIRKEEGEIEDEFLSCIARIPVCLSNVGAWRDHAVDRCHHQFKENAEFGVIFRTNIERCYLGEAFESDIAELVGFEKLLVFRNDDAVRFGSKNLP
jgi:hypothetical protein